MTASHRQRVPRPAGARRGEPPTWGALAPNERRPISLARVRGAFAAAADSPALGAVMEAADPDPLSVGDVEAAVLLACYERGGEAVALLIRRAADLDQDPGHVALPGGHVEPGEPPLAAALRESKEEIGLDPALVEVLGTLPVVCRRTSQKVIPFVAALAAPPDLDVNAAEVEAVIEIRLADLLDDGVAWQERWPGREDHVVRFFSAGALGDDLLWGVTGRIVWSLLELVTSGTAG